MTQTPRPLVSETNFRELKENGYTVVDGVVDVKDCDVYISQYKDWLNTFKKGSWPENMHSCIQGYRISHMEPTWNVRLKAKRVFEQIWKTEQLMTSYDAVAIARPPEELDDPEDLYHGFQDDYRGWLHCDQNYLRQGLHAYQGAVYLEEATELDWTLEVLEGSHKFYEGFFDKFDGARVRSVLNGVFYLKDRDINWYKENGCTRKSISVPKGGMVLWDSRTIHANSRPKRLRPCHDRWRLVVLVCMAPKAWTNSKTLDLKKDAYSNLRMTTHWPCDDIDLMDDTYRAECGGLIKELPEIAKTKEAKMLAGVLPYPDEDKAKSNIPAPKWRSLSSKRLDYPTYYFDYRQLFKLLSILFVIIAVIVGVYVY